MTDEQAFITRMKYPYLSVRDIAEMYGLETSEYKKLLVNYARRNNKAVSVYKDELIMCYYCDNMCRCEVFHWSEAFSSEEFLTKCSSFKINPSYTKIL